MIVIIYGTTGELIKILPLIRGIPESEQFRISTQQQPQQLRILHQKADIPEPNIKIANGRKGNDLEKIWDMVLWLKDISFNYRVVRKNLKKLKKESTGKLLVVVHGDTVTTVLGALFGRLNGLPVAHIEAGLRSGNWRHPFPEEIDRRLVARLATLHFAPGATPVENLGKTKGEVINTRYNTVLDSLRLARQFNNSGVMKGVPKAKYFVVSIHRNELLAREDELVSLLRKIAEKSKNVPCIFLDHPVTKEKINSLKLDNILNTKSITRLGKLQYFQFISLMSKSDFIVTDSGGLQEESAYLGIPCLVHRLTTERTEGLGQNVVLSEYEDSLVDEFLSQPQNYRTKGLSDRFSPTKIILKKLQEKNFIKSYVD